MIRCVKGHSLILSDDSRQLYSVSSRSTSRQPASYAVNNKITASSIFRIVNTLKRDAAGFSETLVLIHQTTLHYIKEELDGDKEFHNVAGTATGYGLNDWGVGIRIPVGSRIVSSPRRSDRFWGPPNLCSGYRRLFRSG
jgi:hypothetical protein